MREPLYKSRPVEPYPALYGGERINDFIVMCEGFSNSYLIETSEGNILINAGMNFEAPVFKKNYDSFSDKPIKYLVLTQGHIDHVAGVQYFREQYPDIQVIAQAGNAEHQAYDERLAEFRASRSAFGFIDKFTDAFKYYAEHGYTDYPKQDRPVPDSVFDDRYTLQLGDLEVELIGIPGAETNDSLIVWLPQHKICFTGNLFGCPFGHFPNLCTMRGDRYRDAMTVAAAVKTVLNLEPEMILYGHHGPIAGKELVMDELTALHGAIMYVHDETVKGMNSGKTVHELMRDIQLPAELEVGQGYGKVSWSIRAIWENYAGWFHQRSTTELYTVPQSDIHGDLIELAGGPGALLERVQLKIDSGEMEQALHLLDIVLTAEPHREEALDKSLTVHQALLERSENFWLSSWLKNQIKNLRERKAGGAGTTVSLNTVRKSAQAG